MCGGSDSGSGNSNNASAPVNDRSFSGVADNVDTGFQGIEALGDSFGRPGVSSAARGVSQIAGPVSDMADLGNAVGAVRRGDMSESEAYGGFFGRMAASTLSTAVGTAVGVARRSPFGAFLIGVTLDAGISPGFDQFGRAIGRQDDRLGQAVADFLGPLDDSFRDQLANDFDGPQGNLFGYPIVLDLDGDGLELIDLAQSSAFFDVDNDDFRENVGWVNADDGFLVTDIDGDGEISDAKEFAIALQTEAQDTDLEAFAALYDSNADGVFDDNDVSWDNVYIWRDLDQNGKTHSTELFTLDNQGIESINLALNSVPENDQTNNGNLVVNKTTYSKIDGQSRQVGDVALAVSEVGFKFVDNDQGVEFQLEFENAKILQLAQASSTVVDASIGEYRGVKGSSGNDILGTNGTYNVMLSGSAGDDEITGGIGDDWLVGGAGADSLSGGAGHDVLFVDVNDSHIDGGSEFDVLIVSTSDGVTLDLGISNIEAAQGNGGDDNFFTSHAAGAGGDLGPTHLVLDGGEGNDTLTGGAGDDLIAGGSGSDFIRGGDGDDTLIVDGDDDYDGGDGEDAVWYLGDEDLDLNITDRNVEIFFSGSGNDTISTDQRHAAAFFGNDGTDTLSGGWGDDFFNGGKDDDVLKGGYGDDTYIFNLGGGRDLIEPRFWIRGCRERLHDPGGS